MLLNNQKILLGVSAGIAAYKAAELVRQLKTEGAEVRVVMTRSAQQFISPLTLQALSGEVVRTELFDEQHEAAMGHIEMARWADQVVIAPATADVMARLAAGFADDLMTTLCLATEAPLFIAPAMNHQMWAKQATQDNAALLRSRGVTLLGPDSGSQACGETGPGRMMEPADIVAALNTGGEGLLAGKKVLITAGPTREPIDPVRYLSNRSSGKMGYAVAAAALAAGAEVTLVSGPVSLGVHHLVKRINVETANEMHTAVMEHVVEADVFIAAAAVSDYRPLTAAEEKIKKTADSLEISFIKNPDILADVAAHASRPFCVGFAAETENLEDYALGKLKKKKLDMIVANPVNDGQGFDRDDNSILVLWPSGRQEFPTAAKTDLAQEIISLISKHMENNAHASD